MGDLVAALGDVPTEAREDEADGSSSGVLEGGERESVTAEPEEGASSSEAEGGPAPQPDAPADGAGVELADSIPVDPDDDLSQVEGEASPRLMSIVESLLFASNKPMSVRDLQRLLADPSVRQIQLALKALIADTQDRGVVLGQVAGGFRLRTNPDNARWVQRLVTGRPVRLSRSQLEALAVIAYRQPITKAEIDHVRGVDCGAVLKVLLERDLIKYVGRKEDVGRPHLYGTTVRFLEFFNLRSLRDMPNLHEFEELSEESQATLRETLGVDEDLSQESFDFSEGTSTGPSAGGDAEGQTTDEPSSAPEQSGEEAGVVADHDVQGSDAGAPTRPADESTEVDATDGALFDDDSSAGAQTWGRGEATGPLEELAEQDPLGADEDGDSGLEFARGGALGGVEVAGAEALRHARLEPTERQGDPLEAAAKGSLGLDGAAEVEADTSDDSVAAAPAPERDIAVDEDEAGRDGRDSALALDEDAPDEREHGLDSALAFELEAGGEARDSAVTFDSDEPASDEPASDEPGSDEPASDDGIAPFPLDAEDDPLVEEPSGSAGAQAQDARPTDHAPAEEGDEHERES